MSDLKLFIWDDVLRDYWPGIVIALAHDVDEARRLILADLEPYQVKMVKAAIEDEPKVYTEPIACVIFGGG